MGQKSAGIKVTVKAAMTLDGRIATARGESKWITGPQARAYSMRLRGRHDAILAGIGTVLADDPGLTIRDPKDGTSAPRPVRRIILDTHARTPLSARVVRDAFAEWTTLVVGARAAASRTTALAQYVRVLYAPTDDHDTRIDLEWLLHALHREGVNRLLVEGGGEVNASVLMKGLADRITFFYAPKVLGGQEARRAVEGEGARSWEEVLRLKRLRWHQLGPDLLLDARVESTDEGESKRG